MKIMLLALSGFISLALFPCTGLYLKNSAGGYVYARTLEFGQDLQSQILFIPRNYQFSSLTPSGKEDGLQWRAKYAAIGANAFSLPYYVDGVNEKGLAGGFFYFPGFAEYQEVKPEHYSKSLPMWGLLSWILTNCATVDEVRNALPTLYVSKAGLPGMKETPPAHLIVHDANGKSLVAEYVKGQLHMHDNPLGVITNSPTFDWHMTNVRNYLDLSVINPKDKTMAGITFSPLGQGAGLVGMPGDFTPPSRFVRITIFTQAAPQAKTELDGINQAFHLLNNFDIPKGTVRDSANTVVEYTQWTSAADVKNKIYYVRTYDNFQIQKASLTAMNLNDTKPTMIPFKKDNTIIEITQ